MAEQTNFCGIICEFNPLHFGHQAILAHAKQIAPVVCVMSGNFVQRGEPAILDKWSRTQLALSNGADLVLELPLPWACAGAEKFAFGAVKILSSLGLSGTLLFGSEHGNSQLLEETADVLLSAKFQSALSYELTQKKDSFAAVRERSLKNHFGSQYAELLTTSNNILGIEYIKAIKRLSANLKPCTISRVGAGHDKTAKSGEFMSASQIREEIINKQNLAAVLPENTASLLNELMIKGEAPHLLHDLERPILAQLRRMTKESFANLPDISEGLEHKLYLASRKANSLEEFYLLTKSKRYSHARIRRLVMSAFLEITSSLPPEPAYIRILGMNPIGERLIRSASPSLPFAVRPSDFKKLGGNALRLFELESTADDLYALSAPIVTACQSDYTHPVIKIGFD